MSVNLADLGEPFATGRSAQIFDWPEGGLVLKLFEAGYPVERADLERRSIEEALRIGVDTAACHGLVEVDGRPGLLLERIAGESLTTRAERNPLQIRSGARALASTHVQLHAAPTSQFSEVREESVAALNTPPLNFLSDRQRAQAIRNIEALPAGDRILHMDFHTENVFRDGDRLVVIDWQTTLRGDPAADVAMTVLLIRDAELWPGTPALKRLVIQQIRGIVLSAYLAEYRRSTGMTDERIRAWRLPVVVLRMSTLDVASERDRLRQEVLSLLKDPR
ncbi:MAG TPA: aminoglycoside phosphotransferase family protein [Actinomycetota bacterium]|nr:aminoglycoside phosphotransferase family protein [Actinomycetota bacterium]